MREGAAARQALLCDLVTSTCTQHGAPVPLLDTAAMTTFRLGFWLWSGMQPQLTYAFPKDGDWRLEMKNLCVAFPEVCCPFFTTSCDPISSTSFDVLWLYLRLASRPVFDQVHT